MAGKLMLSQLAERCTPYYDSLIAFAQKLVQTPSYPGEEGDVAALVKTEMIKLKYDDVWVDRAGNVIGLVRGATSEQSLMLNAHMDHVSVGDDKAWMHPPFSGALVDGALWGRATADLKGSLAAMIYGVAALRYEGYVPPWDVYVAGVVLEEQGGIGTQVLLEKVRPEFCVIGEATRNQLSLGHRGVVGMFAELRGRAAHASMVDIGINPHYSAARFLLRLAELKHERDPMLGPSTVAPTTYITDQTSSNVIPGRVRIYLDWRNVPGETPDSIMAQVETLLQACLEPGVSATVYPRRFDLKTYTGLDFSLAISSMAVKLDPASVLARRSHRALEEALGRKVEQIVWRFCSDGSVCARHGVPIVGFGPGDPELAHTSNEHVTLDELREGMVGHAALALSPSVLLSRH